MNKKKFAIVITTIGDGNVLNDFCRQAEKENVKGQLVVIVIPDNKSPEVLYRKCRELVSTGFNVLCPSLSEQLDYMKRFDGLAEMIPNNSDNRRNIGFLMALEQRCEVLISLDDDNYCISHESIFGEYAGVTQDNVLLDCVESSNGWFNSCELLESEPAFRFFPRGYPYNRRCRESTLSYTQKSVTVRLNAGLWLEDPDLDAITWLTTPVKAKRFKGTSMVLGHGTWAPINTQNTSLAHEAIVAYYFIPMGYSITGLNIDRFGDIFSGYFCQACAKHLGHSIRIGTPIVAHKRNAHNYMSDLVREVACIWMLEDITEWLHDLKLEGATYAQAYSSLSEMIDQQADRFKGSVWTTESKKYLHYVADCMRLWTKTCSQIGI